MSSFINYNEIKKYKEIDSYSYHERLIKPNYEDFEYCEKCGENLLDSESVICNKCLCSLSRWSDKDDNEFELQEYLEKRRLLEGFED